jgi:hypothetical protein
MRRVTASLLLAVVLGAFGVGPAWAALPLSDFTVFGLHGVVIGVGSRVQGSAAGANDALVGAVFDNAITNKALKMNSGTVIEGLARVFQDTDIAASGQITGSPPLITLGNVIAPAAILAALVHADPNLIGENNPADYVAAVQAQEAAAGAGNAICPTGGANFSGANGQSLDLQPGNYGSLAFGSQFNLTLHAGVYVFQSIKAGNGATINAEKGTVVVVCDTETFGSAKVLPTTLTHTDFLTFVLGNDPENSFRIGGNSRWIGDVFTLFGGIHVGSGGSTASVNGRLIAGQVVDIEHGVVVQAAAGPPGPQAAPPKEATLLHGAKNENNGANNSILVKVQVASVVGFPFNTVLQNAGAAIPVTSAILRLFVCNTPNDPNFCPDSAHAPDGQNFTPHDWPANGARDTAFKMADGFERWGSGLPPSNTPPEGNGNNFPTDDNPRGSGAGVTWNCVIDTNILNEAQDCSGPDSWNGGLKAQLTPGVDSTTLITNGIADGAAVDFDVTAQFNAGIGPLDTTFISWFIRKVSGSGFVAYYSSEGSQAKLGANNFSLAPTLIITP